MRAPSPLGPTDARPRLDLRIRRRAAYVALAAIVITFVETASVDVGIHGDEWYHVQAIQMSVAELHFAQDTQQSYNGMYFVPGYLVLAWHALPVMPDVLYEMVTTPNIRFSEGNYPSLVRWKTDMIRLLSTNRYKSEARFVFVLFTAPAILWVFFTVLRLFPNRYLAAVSAAGFLGLSWEVSQRARCIEVDGPQMQFVALMTFFVCCAFTATNRERGLLYVLGVGVAAGLVVGCKVSGATVILSVVATALGIPLFSGARDRLRLLATAIGGELTALYVVSPNTFRDPLRALFAPLAVATDYQSVNPSQPPYVDVPFEHLYRVFQWFFLSVPSSNMLLALGLSGIAIAGLVALVQRRRRVAAVLAIYPLVTLFLLSRMHLLQLRNNLQIVPMLALGFGVGVAWLAQYADRSAARRSALMSFVAAVLVFNGAWLVHADRSVDETTPEMILADVRAYLDEQDYDVRVSPRLHDNLAPWMEEHFDCQRARESRPEHRVLMYYTDHPPWRWKMYRIGFTEQTFASLDENYEWYSTRKGRLEQHRVVLLSQENATEMRVALSSFYDCRRR